MSRISTASIFRPPFSASLFPAVQKSSDTQLMLAQFISTRRVEFADTDMAGIIHFANYYRYMEEAEHSFFRSLGLSIMQPQPDGSVIGWPRVSAS